MDMENVQCTLERISAAFGLILEDMSQEIVGSSDFMVLFYNRAKEVYIPALDLIYCDTVSMLKDMDAEAAR